MVESGRLPGNGRIRASIEKVYGRAREKGLISVRTEKWKNPGEYWKKVESGRVPGKGRIHADTKKLSGRVLENGRISVSTEK